jgi:hypothetical protein
LDELFRATDKNLQNTINDLRDPNQRRPIKLESLQNIPVLSKQLLLERPELLLSRVAVTSNIERYSLLPTLLEHARLLTGECVVWWKKPFVNKGWSNSPHINSIYDHVYYGPMLKQYFQRGSKIVLPTSTAPSTEPESVSTPTVILSGLAMLLQNICPTINLVNGIIGQFHSIIYIDEDNRKIAQENLNNYHTELINHPTTNSCCYEEAVEVPMPDFVLVKFDDSVGRYLPSHLSCVAGECVIPLKVKTKGFGEYSIIISKSKSTQRGRPSPVEKIKYRQFDYEPAAATTGHKLQGQGLSSLIMNLNYRPGTALASLSVNTWIVAMSRVSRTEDFIAFPFYNQKPERMTQKDFMKGQVIFNSFFYF